MKVVHFDPWMSMKDLRNTIAEAVGEPLMNDINEAKAIKVLISVFRRELESDPVDTAEWISKFNLNPQDFLKFLDETWGKDDA